MNDVRDDAWERRLEAGLAENEGGAVPPDVTAAVLARVANGDAGDELHAVAAAPRRAPRWYAAAMALLGLGVVGGAWALQRHERAGSSPEAVAQQQPARDWRKVATRAELDALPADVTFVETYNLGDDDLAALTTRTRIAGLRLVAGTARAGQPRQLLTPTGLRHLSRFEHLRVLHLDWQLGLQDQPLDALADLPLVEELALSRFDTSDDTLAVLDRMPSLRSLDLTLNHGVRGAGMARIARLPGLRSLSLNSCSQLSVAMLMALPRTRLHELDLGHLGRGFRGLYADGDQSAESQRRTAMWEQARRDGAGTLEYVVDALPPTLRRLGLASTDLDAHALRQIVRVLPDLVDLDLSDNEQLTDEGMAQVLADAHLQRLDLSRCKNLGPLTAAAIARCSTLRTVVTLGVPPLAEAIASARGARAEAAAPAAQPMATQDPTPATTTEPPFAVVRTRADLEALDVATRRVDGLDLDAQALAALPRLRDLQHLRLRYGAQTSGDGRYVAPATDARNARSCDDAALHEVLQCRSLQHLELLGTVNVRGITIAEFANLPDLQSLRLSCFDVDDETLSHLRTFRSLRSLTLEYVHGFGAPALRALARHPTLTGLCIAGCPQLTADDLAELGAATGLSRLSLRQLASVRNDSARTLRDDERQHRAAFGDPQPPADKPPLPATARHLNDRALMALQHLTGLRELELTFGAFTSMGLQALAEMHHLELLDLTGNPELVPSAIVHVPPSVQTLRLGLCTGIDDHVAPLLRERCAWLRNLGLADTKCTAACLESLLAITTLRSLDLRRCGLGERGGELLLAATQVTDLDVVACGLTEAQREQLRKQGRRVVDRVW